MNPTMEAITLVRDAAEPGGRNVFSCTRQEWELLVELGQAFGWLARGAAYIRQNTSSADDDVRHGYEAGDIRDPKRVESGDALSWAAALDRARRSDRIEGLIGQTAAAKEQGPIDEAHFAAILDDFIEYAYGGEFSFSRA
jgi:hypothetical protein